MTETQQLDDPYISRRGSLWCEKNARDEYAQLEIRQKAERIVEFSAVAGGMKCCLKTSIRRIFEEAYAISAAPFEKIEEGNRPRRGRRLQDRADDAGHAETLWRQRALLWRNLRARGPSPPSRAFASAITVGSGRKPRLHCSSAMTCRMAAIAGGSPQRSRAQRRRSS